MQQRMLCTASPSLSLFCCVCRVPAGTVDTVLSYCHYSLNDQTVADMFPYFQEKGVGIINASALSMGLLTDQASPDTPHTTLIQPSYSPHTTLIQQLLTASGLIVRKLSGRELSPLNRHVTATTQTVAWSL